MKTRFLPLFLAFFLGLTLHAYSQDFPRYVPNEVIVCVREQPQFSASQVSASQFGQLPVNVNSLLSRIGAASARPLFGLGNAQPAQMAFASQTSNPSRYLQILDQQNRTMVVTLNPGQNVEAMVQLLMQDSMVEFAEPNYYVWPSATPNDTEYGLLWGMENTGQAGGQDSFDPPGTGTAGVDIDAPLAWDTQTGAATTVVAVIDTGLDWDHADIAANVWSNTVEASGVGGVDDDSNGRIDDIRGWDFGENDNNPDDNCFNANPIFNAVGHGSHVSGTIGAVGNNSAGVAGVAWSVAVMPLKVADSSCLISTDDLAAAINYAVNNGAHIINMSLGGGHNSSVQTAVNAADVAGVVMIAAAGNENTSSTDASFPAAYDNVVAVAATDRNDTKASFSNFGSWVAVSGPGVAIRSLAPGGSYTYLSGTSMASPMVAGVAALVKSQYPAFTDSQIISRLTNSAESLDAANPGFVGSLGTGRVNAVRALMSVTSVSPSVGFNSGSVSVTVTGVSFIAGSTLRLTNGSQSVDATAVTRVNSTTLTGTFDLTGLSVGFYNLSVIIGQTTQSLTNGFEVRTVTITDVSPSTAPITSTCTTLNITGVDFTSDLIVTLTRVDPDGNTLTLDAQSQNIASSTTATAKFNISSATIGGRWDLKMTKPTATAVLTDGVGIITDAFKVEPVAATDGQQTFTLEPEEGTQTVIWPSGTVSQDVVLDLDSVPTFNAINTSIDPFSPTGVGIEIVSNPSVGTFNTPATIILTYRDADLADPTKESSLVMGWFDTSANQWKTLPVSTVDTANNTVTAQTTHLTLFAILQKSGATTLNNIVVAPNPYRSDRGYQQKIDFVQLTPGTQIRIYDITGELVRDLTDNDQDGWVTWNLDTDGGEKVASGVYIFLATDPSGNKETGRVGVIR